MMQFFDNILSGLKCHAVKATEYFEKEQGEISFKAVVVVCVFVGVVLLTVFIFRYQIIGWYESWYESMGCILRRMPEIY